MTTAELTNKVRGILERRYPGYWQMSGGKRVLLAMSVLALDIRVREKGGNNRGPEVKAILGSADLGEGNAWCAASIELARQVAKVPHGPASIKGRVRQWKTWAAQAGRLSTTPAAGRLCLYLNEDGTGHIGIIAEVRPDGSLRTYEGNTSSGSAGSQRDGGGLYMRMRPKGYFTRFISLD